MFLILRQEPEASEMARWLRGLGLAATPVPMLRTEFTGTLASLVEPDCAGMTLFTSPRGVDAYIRRLTPAARESLRKLRPVAAVVGAATAKAAREAGFKVMAGDRANGANDLGNELKKTGPPRKLALSVARIDLVSSDPDNPLLDLLRREFPAARCERLALYAMLPDPDSAALVQARLPGCTGLIIGSPRQAEALWIILTEPEKEAARSRLVIVPGMTTQLALKKLGFNHLSRADGFNQAALRMLIIP